MSKTVVLKERPGQRALVLSTDGVAALEQWMQLYDRMLGTVEAGPDFASASLMAKNAATGLALHVRAALDVANTPAEGE